MKTQNYHPTERFSDVVENYNKYRPGYPGKIIEILRNYHDCTQNSIIADIGSGTGIFTKLLLENGNKVFGIEPNDNMRQKSEDYLSMYFQFEPIKGSAEKTTLKDESIDIITSAQSFHWFNQRKIIHEFFRILKNKGKIVLIWNERRLNDKSLMREYDKLLNKYCKDYKKLNHKMFDYEKIKNIFNQLKVDLYILDNKQTMNWEAFIGRLKSCSYCPKPDDKKYPPLIDGMNAVFGIFNHNGEITFEYNTKMYVISL